MNTANDTLASHGITRREGLLTLLGGAMALAGCGGGGGGGGVATVGGGGTGSFSSGPITGFGSIIVNGIRFDDSTASILDDDGVLHNDHNDLKLGMMVRVKGKARAANAPKAEAEEIKFGAELLGPIDSINATAKTLVVLGQTVQITATTIFEEGLAGLAALAVNDIVEVNGFVNPVTNRLVATRIERKLLADVKAFKLQGIVSALDTTAKTFKIGTLTISFAGLATADLPANLADGLLVRVRLLKFTPPRGLGPLTALKIRAVEEEVEVEDRDEVEIEGTITDFTNSTTFKVNGQPVDASGATVPAGLKKGDRVEVEGRLVNGVLVANKVELEDENEKREFELNGLISNLNTTAKTFVVRGMTVDFSGSVTFLPAGKTAANLINGANVEVKGVASTDGTKIVATSIRFEN